VIITANLVNHYEPVISKNRQKQTKMCRNRPKWENSGRPIRIGRYSEGQRMILLQSNILVKWIPETDRKKGDL